MCCFNIKNWIAATSGTSDSSESRDEVSKSTMTEVGQSITVDISKQKSQEKSKTTSQETQLSSSVSITHVHYTSPHLLENFAYIQTSTEKRSESSNSKTKESNWHASGTVSVEAEASVNVGIASGSVKTSAASGGGSATSGFSDEVAEVVDFTSDIASNALQTIKNIAITVEKHENLRAVQEIFMVRAR